MQERTEALLAGCLLATALVAAPAEARLGVDEEAAAPISRALPMTAGADGGADADTTNFDDDEGGFVMKSSNGDFKLLIGGRLQTRFDAISWDDSLDRDTTATFQVRRARMYMIGHVMGEKNRYFVQLGSDSPDAYLGYPAAGAANFRVYDAWVKHTVSDEFSFKFGQFKIPFGRQALTSTGKLQLPDPSLAVSTLFGDARDVGIEASGGFEQGLFQYSAAITNGDGPRVLNADDSLAYMGRISVNPTGDYGYSEGDLKQREEVASTLGVGVHYTENTAGDTDFDVLSFNIDGGVKTKGFSLQGEFFSQKVEPAEGDGFTTKSVYVQGGYFVRPEKLELAARFSRVLEEGDDDDISEYSFGVNIFNWGHRLKWQAAYSLLKWENFIEETTDNRFVVQSQLWF